MNKTKSLVISLLLGSSKADQPIKCSKIGGATDYIGGVWTFYSTAESSKVNLY